MDFKKLKFKQVDVKEVKNFIEQNHYSKSIFGCKITVCFALYNDSGEIKAAVLFGHLSTTAWKKYIDKEKDIIELRRLVCSDDLPKNTESWLIAKCLKELKGKYKFCISYADPYYGHCGFIYQASNWSYMGQTNKDIIYITPENTKYHSRSLRVKYKGEYKPFAKKLRKLYEEGKLK